SQGGRHGLGHVVPFHLSNFAHHQARHVQQGRGGGVTGNGRGQRREKQGQQEQHANGQGGQTGTPTGLHTRGAFHVGGGAAGAQHGTGHNGGTVSQQGAAQTVGFAFCNQAGTLGNPDHGAGGIKHFNQHQHQNYVNKAGVQGTHDVQLHEGRHQRGGSGDHTTKFAVIGQHGQNGHGQNTDQDRAANLQRIQGGNDKKAQNCVQGRRLGQITQTNLGGRVGHHDARVHQGDQTQEHADTGGNRALQGFRDAPNQPGPDAGH